MKKELKKRMKKQVQPKEKEVVLANPNNLPEIRANINPQVLISQAINQNVSIEIMEKLMAMREKLRAEQAEIAFREAMAKFQSACPVVVKSAGVDFTSKRTGSRVRYDYAPLDRIVSAVREVLSKNGLSYTFTTEQKDSSVTAICHAHHVLGHSESTAFTVPVDMEALMNAAQKVASALTYAKRYAFCNAFGILTGDEDTDFISENGTPEIIDSKKTADECIFKMGQAQNLLQLATIAKQYQGLNFDKADKARLEEVYTIRKKEIGTEVK